MLLPKLFTRDLNGVLSWIDSFIAWAERGGFSEVSADATGAAVVASSQTADTFQPGHAIVWLGDTVPSDWVEADGTLIFITSAPNLYDVIGLRYDASPPANMFRLPEWDPPGTGAKWILKR